MNDRTNIHGFIHDTTKTMFGAKVTDGFLREDVAQIQTDKDQTAGLHLLPLEFRCLLIWLTLEKNADRRPIILNDKAF